VCLEDHTKGTWPLLPWCHV